MELRTPPHLEAEVPAEQRLPLLEVDGLVVRYTTDAGDVSAVEDVSFSLSGGEAMGLVGESGCGKTSVALSLLRLAPENASYPSGSIRWEGVDILGMSSEEVRRLRWSEMSMVFQGAMNAWNPVYRVGHQIREAMDQHFEPRLTAVEADRRLAWLFELVGLDKVTADRYPHELSGGMRQRALIAMALSCEPKLVVADEPTTALDVIVQAQILRELKDIQTDLGLAILYISHDMAVIAQVTDILAVMYAGKLVESGPTREVFRHPRHPYTHLLLSSVPSVVGPRRPPVCLDGVPPDPLDPPSGCRFHPRCPLATRRCRQEEPPLEPVGPEHLVACWHSAEMSGMGESRLDVKVSGG
ncbi:MAG: ABC transporter ATP-binding protein [Acidimicrobiaceae bacterium]|nr:ABC transporter ATP-binding protein [Acidimicrobiaceae bacterium]